MPKILFVPLNTNHVGIFQNVVRSLRCEYEVLCHDRISEGRQYHTEGTLIHAGMPFRHFPEKVERVISDNFFVKLGDFFKIKRAITRVLQEIRPFLIIFAIDNDPIAQIMIQQAKKSGIKTLLIQEALIRPDEYVVRSKRLVDYFYGFLNRIGVFLRYSQYGSSNCDKILVSGMRARDILVKRGVPENTIEVIGMPKYDRFIREADSYRQNDNSRIYLFAASTTVVKDEKNVRFLRSLIEAARKLGIYIIIKLHPRSSEQPLDIYRIINSEDPSIFEIIKVGDDTLELLQRAYALITISSTVVLDALLLDKECIVADYLAGESRLDYGKYDAVHTIEKEEQVLDRMKDSLFVKKSYQNKQRLLEDELYKLDGQAGMRAARIIESMIT